MPQFLRVRTFALTAPEHPQTKVVGPFISFNKFSLWNGLKVATRLA